MQPDRRPEIQRRTFPLCGRETTRKANHLPEVPSTNKKTLGALARHLLSGVDLQTDGNQFVLRRTSRDKILTPLVLEPILATHQDGNGSINGGTSKDAIRRAKRQARKG